MPRAVSRNALLDLKLNSRMTGIQNIYFNDTNVTAVSLSTCNLDIADTSALTFSITSSSSESLRSIVSDPTSIECLSSPAIYCLCAENPSP